MIVGVGKTSAFCAIISHLNKPATAAVFKAKFPFFKDYDKFLYIHGSTFNFDGPSKDELNAIIRYIKTNKYFVVMDDAHLLQKSSNATHFLSKVK